MNYYMIEVKNFKPTENTDNFQSEFISQSLTDGIDNALIYIAEFQMFMQMTLGMVVSSTIRNINYEYDAKTKAYTICIVYTDSCYTIITLKPYGIDLHSSMMYDVVTTFKNMGLLKFLPEE